MNVSRMWSTSWSIFQPYYRQSFSIHSLVKVAVPSIPATATLPNAYTLHQ
jgi:hypothetical protein